MKKKIIAIFILLVSLASIGTAMASPATPSTVAPVAPTASPSAPSAPVEVPKTEAPVYETLSNGSNGSAVISLQMRLRDLGYYNYKVTGHYGLVTQNAVKEFQKANKLPTTGTAANMTLSLVYTNKAIRKDVSESAYNASLGRDGVADPAPETYKPTKGEALDWFKTVQYLIPRGKVFTVTDYYTGISWKMKRTGGYNHADCEPATKDDTAKMKKVYKSWSWTRRPLLVTVDGKTIAASYHGMPHAFDRQGNNGMTGHVCIHFLNSRTHVRNLKDAAHQRCVRIATGK